MILFPSASFERIQRILFSELNAMRKYWLVLGSILLFCPAILATEDEQLSTCRRELGMASGTIPDSALMASSSYDEKSVGPLNARIRQEKNGGAWCPKLPVTKEMYEWIQIDFNELKVVSMVETQGRYGNGQGQEFAPNYMLEYQREDGTVWTRYKDKKGAEVIRGNTNTYIAEIRELRPPIIARRMRFIPWSNHPRMMCMRVEVYGCRWTDGTMSYSMRQGDKRGPEIDLFDFTYDGTQRDGYLYGGLGQLTDWEEGITNFRLDQNSLGKKGYEWIGWKNDSNSSHPLEIIFRFDSVRNFTSMRVHVNNLFSKEVSVFRRLLISFSISGVYYNDDVLVYDYLKDSLVDIARYVVIPIPYRIARFVKLVFFFELRWIMLSEIRFESEIVTETISNEMEVNNAILVMTSYSTTQTAANVTHLDVIHSTHPLVSLVALRTTRADVLAGFPNSLIDANNGHPQNFEDSYIGVVVGAAVAFVVVISVVVIIIVFRQKRRKYSRTVLESVLSPDRLSFKLQSAPVSTSGKISNGNIYKSIATNEAGDCEKEGLSLKMSTFPARETLKQLPEDSLPIYELPHTIDYNCPEFNGNSNDLIQGNKCYSLMKDTQPAFLLEFLSSPRTLGRFNQPLAVPPLPPRRSVHPKVPGSSTLMGIQGLTGTSIIVMPTSHLLWQDDIVTPEYLCQKIAFIEKLGEGCFGEVYLCEATGIDNDLDSRATVIVKILRPYPSDQIRLDFKNETKLLYGLNDPNILRLLGAWTWEEGPPAAVYEYMIYGDLFQFLLNRVPENTLPAALPGVKHDQCLSYGCLIYTATQIASGMKYLETLNIVHRDLAARNCLVGQHYAVKIGDLAMSRPVYNNDYHCLESSGLLLPVRWAAWESIILSKFSCKTDIWSFGVTLWEILHFARERPFKSLSNEQVVTKAETFRVRDGVEQYLSQPIICPKEIYDLMKACWNRDEKSRPTFREIHMFLQQKNMGYDPDDDRQYYRPN